MFFCKKKPKSIVDNYPKYKLGDVVVMPSGKFSYMLAMKQISPFSPEYLEIHDFLPIGGNEKFYSIDEAKAFYEKNKENHKSEWVLIDNKGKYF